MWWAISPWPTMAMAARWSPTRRSTAAAALSRRRARQVLPPRSEIEHVRHVCELLRRQGAPEVEHREPTAVAALAPGGIDRLVVGPAGGDDQEVALAHG